MSATLAPVGSSWDTSTGPDGTDPRHLAEWISGSAIAPAITAMALESISGEEEVLSFLRPKALGRIGGYATMPVQRARKTFKGPIQGGWLAHGHAPLDDGALLPVTFKPDHPRLDPDGDPIKYERQLGRPALPFFSPLDEDSYHRIAARAGLTPPPYLSSWEAWRWLLAQSEVELCLDEGEKKAAAACSAGWLTIGLAGIYGGCPRPRDASGKAWGSPTLLAELNWLKTIRPKGAPLTIAFDASEKPAGIVAIRKARRTLGHLLAADGHKVSIREMVQSAGISVFIKGTDDLLTHGGPEALAGLPVAALDGWLKASSTAACRQHLQQPFRTAGRRVDTIQRHFRASDIPMRAPLVALIGGMGSNKTGAVAEFAQPAPLLSLTHRRSLADQQGSRLGLPVKREGKILHAARCADGGALPAAIEAVVAVNSGFITVADSSYPGGSGELLPEHCAGKTLFIDEADAFLNHCLMADTAIKAVRCEVLANLARCIRTAERVVIAGAHLDELTLRAFEAMRGQPAAIVRSTLATATGRPATVLAKPDQLLQQARNLATAQTPFLFHTSAMETRSSWAPCNLAKTIKAWWPAARILEITSKTIREAGHPAAAALRNPELLLSYDVVLASPVLETGFSIEDPGGHFGAVLAHTSGHTTPTALVQSIGRLRSGVPRFIYVPSSGQRIGSGSPWADALQTTRHEHAVSLYRAGANLPDPSLDSALFFRWWAELAAQHNWISGHYREATATLLEAEGYGVTRRDLQGPAATDRELEQLLTDARDASVLAEAAAVAAAPQLDEQQLEALEAKPRHTREERAAIERARITQQLGISSPTPEQVICVRDGAPARLLRSVLMKDPALREQHRAAVNASLTPSQRSFAPDFTAAHADVSRAQLLSSVPKLTALVELSGTGKTVTTAGFEQLHQNATADRSRWREVFGFDPGAGSTRTFMASLLKVVGLKLQRTQRRERHGERTLWHYEVMDPLRCLRGEAEQHLRRTLASTGLVSFSR